jgi:hypothetical protein
VTESVDWLARAKATVAKDFTKVVREGGLKPKAASLQWSSFNRRTGDSVLFWIEVSGLDRGGELYVGSDEAQVTAFINSGSDRLAAEILEPLGVLETYRRMLALLSANGGEPYCVMSDRLGPRDPLFLERSSRLLRWQHRYRWSDEAAVGDVLRATANAVLRWTTSARTTEDRAAVRAILGPPELPPRIP